MEHMYMFITKYEKDGVKHLLANIVKAKTRLEVVKKYHVCVDNVYSCDLLHKVITYWRKRDILIMYTNNNCIFVNNIKEDKCIELKTFREFRDYVDAYRMR